MVRYLDRFIPEILSNEAMIDHILKDTIGGTRQFWPIRGEEDDTKYDPFFETMQQLGFTKQALIARSQVVGEEIYNDRFNAALIEFGLIANGLDRVRHTLAPRKCLYYHEYLTYLAANPCLVMKMREAWERQVRETGLITYPTPNQKVGSIEKQVEEFIEQGWPIDVYSSPKRTFPKLRQQLATMLGRKHGTLIDVAGAGGDFAQACSDMFGQIITTDIRSADEISTNQMMLEYRWTSETDARIHFQKLISMGIQIEQADLFDTSRMKEIAEGLPRPLVIANLTCLIPHFHSRKLAEGMQSLLCLKPDILAIGGVVPPVEYQINEVWTQTSDDSVWIYQYY